ncbi:cation:proton antiporter [Frigoribacterium endophyticum]|uniref:cation:proton antiporter n=1 Tax=Frigoribacterium endophyticum TaxID=1522176 RepID=UPI001421AC36|nr:sodium:proton antiporter [Frigoribacterium endophyticum]NII52335.1 CPA1 family monovalent cation:H+ antiporter [Frigoribacterium endophyticum]
MEVTELLAVLMTALLVIAAATLVGPRLRVAAPLLLVAIGVGASFLPAFAAVEIDPELILAGVLPPLLYSSAVSMPAMNFRREFGAISGLSVVLVVASALVLGVFFMLVLPDLGFAWGVALGAVISPTDAVATSIVRQTSVSKRVVAMLDGESLLNDATALVLLRTAIVATAASFSVWGAVGTFAYSVVVALVIGLVVGAANLALRRRVTDSTVNTVISFAVPFVASLPASAVGASGLVAAVVAGLVTGVRAPRELSPQNRLSDSQNWRTVELVLEGAVFLTMGLQIRSIVVDVQEDHAGVAPALLIAVGALVLTIVVRAAYVAPLLRVLSARARHAEAMQPRVQSMHEQIRTEGAVGPFAEMNRRGRSGPSQLAAEAGPEGVAVPAPAEVASPSPSPSLGSGGSRTAPRRASRTRSRRTSSRRTSSRTPSQRTLDQFTRRVTQGLADIEYFLRQPLGWRDGTAVVWAGMRGAVTVAAAQTLPEDTPQRPVLVLIAFAVAALSLLVQGGTVGPLLKRLSPPVDEAELHECNESERTRIFELMRASGDAVPAPEAPVLERSKEAFDASVAHTLAMLAAQRSALLDARDNGLFDADVLADALANLDASEIAIALRGRLAD